MLAGPQSLPSSEQAGRGPTLTETTFASRRLPASLAAAGRTSSAAVTADARNAAPKTTRDVLTGVLTCPPWIGCLPLTQTEATNRPLTRRRQIAATAAITFRN